MSVMANQFALSRISKPIQLLANSMQAFYDMGAQGLDSNLAELEKIGRVISRELPDCSRENLLVLDATTGQNAVSQAQLFSEVSDITGIVLTKLDGTAKGGIVISICSEKGIPVKFIGVGEGIDDLQPFDPEAFAKALFEDEEEW